MANTKKTIEQILATEGTDLTPYEVFRILENLVSQLDRQPAKALRPQFVYNYDRNGLIVKGYNMASRDGLAGRYSVEQATAWATAYIQKNQHKWTGTKVTPVDPFATFTGEDSTEVEGQLDMLDEIDA